MAGKCYVGFFWLRLSAAPQWETNNQKLSAFLIKIPLLSARLPWRRWKIPYEYNLGSAIYFDFSNFRRQQNSSRIPETSDWNWWWLHLTYIANLKLMLLFNLKSSTGKKVRACWFSKNCGSTLPHLILNNYTARNILEDSFWLVKHFPDFPLWEYRITSFN